MFVSMRNAAGHVRQVKVGISWTALFFGGLPFFFRGMPLHGVLWSLGCWFLLIPWIFLIFLINKITAKYWLARGYQPIGEGWDYARAAWGLPVAVPASSPAE